MSFKKLLLPLGIIIAIIFSLIIPYPGILVGKYYGISITVIAIFLVYGYTHDFKKLKRNKNILSILITATVVSLFLGPLLGLAVSYVMLPSYAMVGLIVVSSMPPTLSSGVVLTEVAGGNALLAIIITIFLNIIAIFVIPTTLHFSLGSLDVSGLSPFDLFIKLSIIVLIPLIIGFCIKKISIKHINNYTISLIPTICVILAIWICMSRSATFLKNISMGSLLIIILSIIIVHFLLLIINYTAGTVFKFKSEDKKALVFVGSQKTLPLAAFIVISISSNNPVALVVCVLFQILQILIDSIIAAKVSR